MEPFSATAIFAGINSAFKFADFAIRIAEVGTENEVFVRTIQVVRTDLTEAQRLLSCESIQRKLKCNPAKLSWINSSINNTKTALFEIGRWVERARADHQATGSIKFETRVRWVFNDHEKLVNRQSELSACHQQLSNVLAFLTPLEELVVVPDKPPIDEATDFDDFLSPRQRRQTLHQNETPHSHYVPSKEKQEMYRPHERDYHQQAPLSDSKTNTLQHNSSSYPSSPPPAYASVIQNTPPQTTWSYQAPEGTKCSPYTNTAKPNLPSMQPARPFDCDAKSAEVYEYRDPRYGDRSTISTNDAWCMSATNLSGPVDPLGMYAELAGQPVSSAPTAVPPNTTSVREVSELFGDLSFRAELPGSDTGPLPGYPLPESNTPLSRKPINSPYYSMPHANHSEANNAVHELPSPPLPTHNVPSFGPSELPSCMSSSFRPTSSAPLPDHRTTYTQTTSPASHQPSLPQIQSASSIRRQHQKTYMDMLGSLGTS